LPQQENNPQLCDVRFRGGTRFSGCDAPRGGALTRGRTVATFGGLVRERRQAVWLTQEQLADKSGLSVRTIQALERDQVARPRRESVRLLADALGLTGFTRTQFEVAARHGSAAGSRTGCGTCQIADLVDCLAHRLRDASQAEAVATLTRLVAALAAAS